MRCQFLLSPHPGCLRGFVVCMTWILRPHHVSSDVRTDHCGVRHLGSLCQLLLLITPTFSSLCISFLLLIITPRHGGAPQSFVVCMTWILRPHDVSSDVLTDHCGVRHLCQLLLLLTPTFRSVCISFLLLIIASAPRHGGAPKSPEVVIAEQRPKKARFNVPTPTEGIAEIDPFFFLLGRWRSAC